MDELPGNSNRQHSHNAPSAKPEKEKIEKVVSGEVVRRKKTRTRRVYEMFFGIDAKNAMRDAFFETMIPGAQEAVLNSVNEALQRAFFKEVRYPLRGPGSRMGMLPFGLMNPLNQTNYAGFSPGGGRANDPRTQVGPSRRARASFDFDEIVLGTKVDAMEVIAHLKGHIDTYGMVSVVELYTMLGITPEWTEQRYGWTDLSRAGVSYTRDGYVLNLPRPEPLPD